MKSESKFTYSKVLDLLGIFTLLIFWIIVLKGISGLPEEIPLHFNYKGEVDSLGPKQSAYLLPSIATILYILLTIANRYPEKFNYPFPITERNAERHYRLAGNFIRVIRLIIQVVFMLIFIVISSNNHSISWLLPSILLIIFLPVIIYIYSALRINSEANGRPISK